MTRRTVFLISLAFIFTSVVAIGADSTNAQTQMYVARTGILKVYPGQTLRLTATNVGSEPITLRFRTSKYAETSVGGSVFRMQKVSQTTSDAITIEPGEAAGSSDFYLKIDTIDGDVISTSPDLKLTAFVISPASSSGGSSIQPMEQISFNFTNITFE